MPHWEQRLHAGRKILLEAGFEGFVLLKVSELLFRRMTGDDILADEVISWELIGVTVDERLLDYDFVFVPEDHQ